MQNGDWLKAGLNVLLNVVVCIFAAWLGIQMIGLKHG
jgi:CrcB protein